MSYLELMKRAEARLRQEGKLPAEQLVTRRHDNYLLREPLAPPPVTPFERLADLDAEEALLRDWWSTLPDRPLARRCFYSYVAYYCQEKDLGKEIERELERRCQDLLEKKL